MQNPVTTAPLNFSKDDLGRQKFADLLIGYAAGLGAAINAPSGRVIAVDAPWGSGKSWIAKRLPSHLTTDKRIGACVYVDAFQFDYHQDPFAVLTSAILDGLKDEHAAVSNLKDAAVKVLKTTLPAIGKGLVKMGGRAVGIDTDELVAGALNAAGDSSESVIKQMLDTFAQTNASTEAFKKKLGELATANKNSAPLVVVIDELDRCRPNFALELLERVKHLFEVPNVVFILFMHTPALHSAIRKTYGHEINPSEYLRKFIALTVGLPTADSSTNTAFEQSDFLKRFVDAQYPLVQGRAPQFDQDFRQALCDLAPAFNASFRDIENAMLLLLLTGARRYRDGLILAIALLLRIREPDQLQPIRSSNPDALRRQAAKFGSVTEYEPYSWSIFRAAFTYAADPSAFEAALNGKEKLTGRGLSSEQYKNVFDGMLDVFDRLKLEYVRV